MNAEIKCDSTCASYVHGRCSLMFGGVTLTYIAYNLINGPNGVEKILHKVKKYVPPEADPEKCPKRKHSKVKRI